MATTTVNIWDSETTYGVATTNYKTFDTTLIQSSGIPKYSKITNAQIGIKIKTNVSITKASLYFAFSNRSGSRGSPNGTKIKDFGDCLASSEFTGSASLLPYVHSENESAGKYNGSYPYFLYWSEGTLRKWTLRQVQLYWSFTKPTYQVSVSSNNTSWGTVSGSGTWDVETTDFTKTITAVPNAHCRFVKWDDGNTNATRSLTISQNGISSHTTTKSYTAIFAPDTYTVTVNTDGNGTVTGGGTYEYGKSVTLIATPSTGYKFVKWSDGNTNNPRTVTVTGAATYTAQFEADKVNKIYIGNSLIKGVYVGSSTVKAVYIGNAKIYG